ncbi:SGNH/GDSL hydrolase family protein [Variovorax sp. J31P207]|jgi:hypothetical protein|uniref:SGNH/GDSL hydrolase family protein n=1 Tax=Variovorax sp. J31P207 TaxID=3053510 RepID=UPI0025771B23|nr:SGNH/GDSL hydrolase family protein [Variovorax sp. J31P207]MDM0072352.1 SGNH/GDSL hydrolase family protein [Variovorax sp. J31P207]
MIRSMLRPLAAVLVTGVLAGYWGGAAAQDASLCTVEIFGDSIMGGNGSPETPSMTLQRIRPNLQIVADHAVAGMSLRALATFFPYVTLTAHYVIIENGVIDAWDGLNINTVMYEYAAMVKKVRNEGRVPVLTGFSHQAFGGDLGYPQLWRRDFYDTVIQAVANNASVAFADWGSVPFFGEVDLLDFVHPNKGYSDRLIGRLAMTLDPLITNCTAVLVPPA